MAELGEHARDVPTGVVAEDRYARLLQRVASHPLAVRLEKTQLELRAELGRSPSARETWLEFQARHPIAARHLLASVAREAAGESHP
jgi:hypothetical protein